MRNRSKLQKWKAAVLAGILLTGLIPLYSVRAAQADTDIAVPVSAQADMDVIVSASAQILYNNEGSYNSVNPNDNGAVSIGKLQWHGWRALSLLQTIVSSNKEQAQEMLGSSLYKEVVQTEDTSKWGTRKLSASEAAAVRTLLATDESKSAQDTLAVKDITSYIQQGQRLGIKNEAALVYFADLANQGGSGASGRVGASASRFAGSYEAVTLNELHQAAICDSVMGAYLSRRFATYKYASALGWTYCSPSDSYIPSDYVTARDSGAAWVQRALNTCMNAGLTVTDTYDQATKEAVIRFQAAKKLDIDGFSGRETIVALIKATFQSESVTPPDTPVQDPGTSAENPGTSAGDPGTSGQNPGTSSGNTNISAGNSGTSAENPGTSSGNQGTSGQDPGTSVENPDVQPEKPEEISIKTVLKASKTSYAVNDNSEPFMLNVTSSHTIVPITYRSSDESVAEVRRDGRVTVKGPGQAAITVSQEKTGNYTAAEQKISITVYSTDPSDYQVPTGALYAGKNMKKQQVQWLQAALIRLNGANITVNGSWSKTMTQLLTAFQKKCAIEADGIAGDQTQDLVKKMLAVKAKKPQISVKSGTKAKTVSWKKYAKANRVYIYRKEKGGSYKRIKTITNMKKTSYQDSTVKKGKTYYYMVRYGYVQGKLTVRGPESGAVK